MKGLAFGGVFFSFLVQKLRGELDRLLKKKIEEPGLDISKEGKGVVAAVVELLHSQQVQY